VRPLYFIAGLMFVGLGIAGYILPVMPGTVFLILAAGCFARSSPKLEHWLVTHPRLGPPIVAWRETGAIPRPIKIIAIGSMAISMTIVCLSPAPEWVDWLVATILIACAAFVATRPVKGKAAG
jgi:uncharacterized membrane protein YbaN (DUF454 family)